MRNACGVARRFLGIVVMVGALIGLVEVPRQLGILADWASAIQREHVAWVALVVGLGLTIWGNWDKARRLFPERLRRVIERHPKGGPARYVHLERPYPILDREDRIGFGFRVFNGNPTSVSITAAPHQLTYGEDGSIATQHITVETPPMDIPAAKHRELRVYIDLKGAIAEEIRADFANGELKPIKLDGLQISVRDGQGISEPAILPDAVVFRLVEKQWVTGRHLGSLLSKDKLQEVIEGMILP